jgi:[acyl-carrier-protein] S-malonyltransferase
VLGKDPRWFVRGAAAADLFSDRSGQILCCTQALAAWAALGTSRPARAVVAGYSVGELAAWGCAGAVGGPSTLRLAQRRAALMDAATPFDGGLAAVVGLRRRTLEPILVRHAVSIAIVVDVDSFVIGGSRTGLEAARQEAVARGARHNVSLPVAVPSHTPLLREATEQFRAVLDEASPRLPPAWYRLLSGIDGDTIRDIEARDRQAGASDLDHHRLGGLPRRLPVGRGGGGPGTRSRNRVESDGVGALSRRPRPRC